MRYCGIGVDDLYRLNILNPRTKKRYENIGVDRMDNSRSYELANLIPCCPPCNHVKGHLLTYEEIRAIGPNLRSIWIARLGPFKPGENDHRFNTRIGARPL